MSRADLHTDRRSETPLYRQLYDRFRDNIAAGRLQPGDRVPSVRGLASELNLSRGTVELAYQVLISEGYLLARGAAGTVVSPQLIPQRIARAVGHHADSQPQEPAPSSETPLPFQLGLPALDAVPVRLWRRLMTRHLRESSVSALDYPDPQGRRDLRNALAAYLGVSRGIDCDADQIFITAGYREALRLIRHALLRTGDCGWFEEPGYFKARDMLQLAGLSLVPAPVDANGLDVSAARERAENARFAVVTPSHQSPTGVSLSLPRRLALLEWAVDNASWIIEDDYDSEYRYQGRPIPALKSLDSQGRVLYTGTFSKVLFPGLRLAYLVVPRSEVERFRDTVTLSGSGCSDLPQSTLADFINQGHFARHLRRMRALYSQRRAYLRQALEAQLGDRIDIDLQAGGMHLLVRFDNKNNDLEIARRARSRGLSVQAFSTWFQDHTDQAGLILGFTNIVTAEEAAQHVGDLKAAFDD
ncbi:PLP-dependent aminotransferase family protein [Salinisphaera hydrothermalis]|uniref:MocR-like pyridoxine biosynthesis transcription factor PdxR n=1 Tax=Salinisphaera hydrothermalis TaxID=563188 RepID=UPI003342917D